MLLFLTLGLLPCKSLYSLFGTGLSNLLLEEVFIITLNRVRSFLLIALPLFMQLIKRQTLLDYISFVINKHFIIFFFDMITVIIPLEFAIIFAIVCLVMVDSAFDRLLGLHSKFVLFGF